MGVCHVNVVSNVLLVYDDVFNDVWLVIVRMNVSH